ncbi:MAG: hypothetical protein JO149_07195 [Gammaproteobacteria bacterium]|nr:hypothetical protein [Gammaproteobacteria bacterium]
MRFIKLTVKNPTVLHGFDKDNKEILEKCEQDTPITKIIAIDRIKSMCKDLVLIDYADGRWIFWEYEERFEDINKQLKEAKLLLSD